MEQARAAAIQWLLNVDLDGVIDEIRAARTLPRLDYHFEGHRVDLRITTRTEYIARLRRHLQRRDLRFFVMARKQGDIMWYAVHLDSGEVAQYNASKHRLWSFYRSRNPEELLSIPAAIHLEQTGQGWRLSHER